MQGSVPAEGSLPLLHALDDLLERQTFTTPRVPMRFYGN